MPSPSSCAPPADPPVGDLQEIVRVCDTKLERYRAAPEAGADPAVVTEWIAQVRAERTAAETAVKATPAARPAEPARARLTEQDLRVLIDRLGNITDALATADPDAKARVYRALGMILTYDPHDRTAHIKIKFDVGRRDSVGVRGPILTEPT